MIFINLLVLPVFFVAAKDLRQKRAPGGGWDSNWNNGYQNQGNVEWTPIDINSLPVITATWENNEPAFQWPQNNYQGNMYYQQQGGNQQYHHQQQYNHGNNYYHHQQSPNRPYNDYHSSSTEKTTTTTTYTYPTTTTTEYTTTTKTKPETTTKPIFSFPNKPMGFRPSTHPPKPTHHPKPEHSKPEHSTHQIKPEHTKPTRPQKQPQKTAKTTVAPPRQTPSTTYSYDSTTTPANAYNTGTVETRQSTPNRPLRNLVSGMLGSLIPGFTTAAPTLKQDDMPEMPAASMSPAAMPEMSAASMSPAEMPEMPAASMSPAEMPEMPDMGRAYTHSDDAEHEYNNLETEKKEEQPME